jgi:hypothetical protein
VFAALVASPMLSFRHRQAGHVIAWHRKAFRLFWTWKSPRGPPRRPAMPHDVRDLIRRMSRENPLWGALRIRISTSCVEQGTMLGL